MVSIVLIAVAVLSRVATSPDELVQCSPKESSKSPGTIQYVSVIASRLAIPGISESF